MVHRALHKHYTERLPLKPVLGFLEVYQQLHVLTDILHCQWRFYAVQIRSYLLTHLRFCKTLTVSPETSVSTDLRCVTTQKSRDLIYTAVET
jgi:hypothetical protein